MFRLGRLHLLETEIPNSSSILHLAFIRMLENTDLVTPDYKRPVVLIADRQLRVAFARFNGGHSFVNFVFRIRLFRLLARPFDRIR